MEFIEQIKNPQAAQEISSTKLFELIRIDLCSNEFEPFEGLEIVSLTIPNEVIVVDSDGNKHIQFQTN